MLKHANTDHRLDFCQGGRNRVKNQKEWDRTSFDEIREHYNANQTCNIDAMFTKENLLVESNQKSVLLKFLRTLEVATAV